MGRQLQLATTRNDEVELLRQIASLTPLRVFRSHAATQEQLWLAEDQWAATPPWDLYLWPQTFAWSPTYGQTGGPGCPPERAGFWYVANANTGPVLELSRADLPQRLGRIYWGDNFSAPHGLDYDRAEFSQLVDVVWRWIRKVGKRQSGDRYAPYYLPDAAKNI